MACIDCRGGDGWILVVEPPTRPHLFGRCWKRFNRLYTRLATLGISPRWILGFSANFAVLLRMRCDLHITTPSPPGREGLAGAPGTFLPKGRSSGANAWGSDRINRNCQCSVDSTFGIRNCIPCYLVGERLRCCIHPDRMDAIMKVLVTGANGFVGTALQGRLRHEGYNIKAITRKEVGDIDSRTEWALHLENIETIVHLAGRAHVMQETESDPLAEFRKTNRDGTACLAQCAIASGVRRIVFISSVKVNGEASNDPFNASSPAMPQDPYAISKFEAEQALETLRSELEIVIFRPPLVYGPNVRGNFIRLIELVDRGLPLPLASVENLRSLVGLTNLTDAICWGIRAQPGLYFPSDRQDQSTADLIRRIADAHNRPARLFPMHPLFLKVAGNLTGKRDIINRLTGSLTVDGDLPGWSPPESMDAEIERTVHWYKYTKNASS